jgi:HAD superfamily hydrolase (TIGR01549 family)
MPAFIFDLDGTLIDSVYAHVLAWQQALRDFDIPVDGWRINRRMGMSGGLLLHALSDELNCEIEAARATDIEKRHSELFQAFQPKCRPLKGAVSLLQCLKEQGIPFGVATSGNRPGIDPSLEALGIIDDTIVIEGKGSKHPKPEPDELVRCQEALKVKAEECFVVGDAVWDLLAASRAQMFSIGLLTGGYASAELFEAGAHRVFADPAELKSSLYQLGIDGTTDGKRS